MKHFTYENMLARARHKGVNVIERKLIGNLSGFYLDEMKTIVIDQEAANFQKRCTLCHELIHAQYGDNGCGYGLSAGKKAEYRTRRLTALFLISPVAYASAESLYEGNGFLIAQELDVTVQVVEDYRTWLHDHVEACANLIPLM